MLHVHSMAWYNGFTSLRHAADDRCSHILCLPVGSLCGWYCKIMSSLPEVVNQPPDTVAETATLQDTPVPMPLMSGYTSNQEAQQKQQYIQAAAVDQLS